MAEKRHSRSMWWLVGLCVAVLLVTWPLLRSGFYSSDDGEWMVIRLSAFYQNLKDGQFPVRYLSRLNHGYGYPVANFLYPGFLYIGSMLHVLGLSYADSVKVILIGSIITLAFAIYSWLRTRFSVLASFAGSVSAVFSPYLFFDIYKRGSVGEVMAIAVGSLLLMAIERQKQWLIPPAVALLIISHNSLALLFASLLLGYVFYRRFTPLLMPFAIGVIMTCFFWIPALVERRFVRFDHTIISDVASYFIRAETVPLVGLVFLAAACFLLIRKKKVLMTLQDKFFFVVFWLSLFFVFPFSKPVWDIDRFAILFQFPYRMLGVTLVAGSWLVAKATDAMGDRNKVRFFVLCGVLLAYTLVPGFGKLSPIHQPDGYYSTNEATTTVANEYMPLWVSSPPEEHAWTKVEFLKGRGQVVEVRTTSNILDMNIETVENSLIQINTLYYPGWGVTVNGAPWAFSYTNPKGAIQMELPKGSHRVVAEFRETALRYLADTLSAAGIGGYIVYGGYLMLSGAASGTRRRTL